MEKKYYVSDTCDEFNWELMELEEIRDLIRGYWEGMQSENLCDDEGEDYEFEADWEELEGADIKEMDSFMEGFGYGAFDSLEEVKDFFGEGDGE